MRAHKLTAALAAVPVLLAGTAGLASADNLQDSISDAGQSVALVAGSTTGVSASIKVVGNNNDGTTTDAGCNWDAGEQPLVLDVVTPAGVTATPDPVSITECGKDVPLTFVADDMAVGGTVTVAIVSTPAGGGGYSNQVSIPVTVSRPAPVNTAPQVSVAGVADGATYDLGQVPDASCTVVDAEDTDEAANPQLSAVTGPYAEDGIGTRTATCSYTDKGGLLATASATYTTKDPSAPIVTPVLDPATPDGDNGWYRGNVSLTWTVEDAESPRSVEPTDCEQVSVTADQTERSYTCRATSAGGSTQKSVTIKRDGTAPEVSSAQVEGTRGANGWYTSDVQVTFTATDMTSGATTASETVTSAGEGTVTVASPEFSDHAGNTAPAGAASGSYQVDLSDPARPTFVDAPATQVYYGQVPVPPTCTSSDEVSGISGCEVTGGGSGVGRHTYTATATDNAGRTSTASFDYEVLPWTSKGFYSPVDMGSGVVNTVKGGSTVPMKFEVFVGVAELTTTAAVTGLRQKEVSCNGSASFDDIEILGTGGTSLRYDATAGQFIQNWQTPKRAGACFVVTVGLADGSSLSAGFKLK